MHRPRVRRRCFAAVLVASLAVGPGLVPSAAQAGRLYAPDGDPGDFDGWMVQAEQQRAAGEHAAAARSYAAAYRALPTTEQVGLMGEIAIDNALSDYGAAYEQGPGSVALLEEEVALLDEFVEGRARAHESGKAEAVPQRLQDERSRLREQLDQARARAAAGEPGEASAQVEPGESPGARSPGSRSSGESKDAAGGGRRGDAAILGTGLASLVGGVALIGGGVWDFGKIDRQRRARLTALEQGAFTEQARQDYRAELTDWQDRWRGTATGLVVAGSVLAAAGIAVTAWGVVRMRQRARGSGRRASVGVPVPSRRQIGVAVKVGF